MKIDTSVLEKALNTLKRVLDMELDVDNLVRDSAIQRFEYTYELSFKILRRKLEDISESPTTIEQMPFRDIIRTAAEKGLIDNPVMWFKYREMRNLTSHAYDEKKSEAVYNILKDFAQSAEYLLNSLKN